MLEKVQNDPVSVKMLAINGDDLISVLKLTPGPKFGAILDVLLGEVLEDPARNERSYLLARAEKIKEQNLDEIREQARKLIEEKRDDDDQSLQRRFKV